MTYHRADIVVSAANVSLRLGGREIVSGISLQVKAGEVVALIGPNGAGKSSLLRMLAGEVAPTAGSVSLCGRPLAGWPGKVLARRRAVVPQDTRLDFAFSALEVVLIGRSPHLAGGNETARDRQAALAALERVQAGHLAGRLYPSLSGGERQRVQIARALAQIDGPEAAESCCLLLDEHTASLDPAHQHGMFQLAREVAADGAGVLAVVHDLTLAATYADRIAVLNQGRLVAFGPAEAALSPDIIGAVFGLSSSVLRNPLDGTLVLATAPRGRVAPFAGNSELRA